MCILEHFWLNLFVSVLWRDIM